MKKTQSIIGLVTLGAGVMAPLRDAEACGGFFCNNQEPVDQSAERILFAVDESQGTVDAHVQIFYTGESDSFAWVVPVPEVPDLYISTDELFSNLDAYTQPNFRIETEEWGLCTGDSWYGGSSYYDVAADGGSTSTSEDGVNVVSEEIVGPYNAVVLQADSEDELLKWLQGSGYDLPETLGPALAPYVAGGQYFVAIKLLSDKDTGDIQPLGMQYEGSKATVPIQLTSIAATPDMRLEIYVLGDKRSVPESYLHVKVNDARVDWWSWDNRYEEAISLAADEAGGHAFATDYSGTTDLLLEEWMWGAQYDVDALKKIDDPVEYMEALMSQGFTANALLLSLLQEYIPAPKGVDEQDFYNWMSDYADLIKDMKFDGAAFTADIYTYIVEPLERSRTLFETYPSMTRMTSSLDAVEMTVDPVFVFNGDMTQDVAIERVATMALLCGAGTDRIDASRIFALADGRTYNLPSIRWFWDSGMTEYEYIQDVAGPYAIVIEETSAEGEPKTIADYTDYAQDLADGEADEEESSEKGGCGCATGAGPAGATLALSMLGLALARRRRE